MNSSVTSVAFSPDGNVLAIGRVDGTIDLFNLRSQQTSRRVIAAYDPHRMIPVGALALSPDGNFLASGAGLTLAADDSIPAFKLWRLTDLSLAKSDLPNAAPIRQISWTKDGSHVAVAAGDHTVRIGCPTLRPRDSWISLPFAGPTMSLAFSPADDELAVVSGALVEIFVIPR